MKKNLMAILALAAMAMLSCQSKSTGTSQEMTTEEQTVLADSLANEIDMVIQTIQEETQSTAEEIDSLLEGI